MPSLASYFYRFLIRRYFAHKKLDCITRERHSLDALGARLPLAREVRRKAVTTVGVDGEWLEPAGAAQDAAILYLHGGAYLLGSCNSHRSMASYIAQSCRLPLLLIDYRLAPEHPYPAALDDAEQAFFWLLNERGVSARRIILMGDSAGGGLALALALRLKQQTPSIQAGAVVAMSPWTDLTMSGASVRERLRRDPCFATLLPLAEQCTRAYAAQHPLTLAEISPLYGDAADFPPLLIQVGTEEILFSDAQRVAHNAMQAGVNVQFSPWQGMWHVWQCLVPKMKESRQAIEEIGTFCRQRLTEESAETHKEMHSPDDAPSPGDTAAPTADF